MLTSEDKTWVKGAIVDGVLEAFNKVIVPYMEDQEERVGKRIDEVETKLTTRIDDVEEKLTTRIDEVESKLGKRIDEVEDKLTNEIHKVERKLDRITDHQADVIDDLKSRVKRKYPVV